MQIKYKIDVLAALKERGYTSYYLRQSKLLCEDTIQAIRAKRYIAPRNLAKLSIMLERPAEEIAVYLADDSDLRWVNQRIEECNTAFAYDTE